MKWDVASSDTFYTVFHMHDLLDPSFRRKQNSKNWNPAQVSLFRKMHFLVKLGIRESQAAESCTDERSLHL